MYVIKCGRTSCMQGLHWQSRVQTRAMVQRVRWKLQTLWRRSVSPLYLAVALLLKIELKISIDQASLVLLLMGLTIVQLGKAAVLVESKLISADKTCASQRTSPALSP